MADRTIRVTVVGDSRSLQSALKQSEKSLGSLDRTAARSQQSLAKMESGFQSFGKGAALLAGASALSAAFIQVTEAASRLQTAQAANDRIWGAQAANMQEAAKASQAYGLSQAQYLQTAAKIGTQLQNLGMEQDSAAVSAQSLMRMGENLAAVWGGDVPQAMTAISAALRGEFDPIENYGIGIKAAEVASRQAAEGISKAQAIIDIAMEQSTDTIGAAAAAQDTYAGKQRALAASWEDAQAAIGKGFLPAAGAAVDMLTRLANAVSAIPQGVREFAGSFVAVALAVKGAQIGLGMLAAKTTEWAANLAASETYVANGAKTMGRLSTALTKIGNSLPIVGALVLGFAEAMAYLDERIAEGATSMQDFAQSLSGAGSLSGAQLDSVAASINRVNEGLGGWRTVLPIVTGGVSVLVDKWLNADFYSAQTEIDNLNKALSEMMTLNPAQGAAATFAAFDALQASGFTAAEATQHLAGSLVTAQSITAQYGQTTIDAAAKVQALTAAFDAASQRATAFGQAMEALFAGLDVGVAVQRFKEAISGIKAASQGGFDASEIQALNQAWVTVSESMFKAGASTREIIARYDQMRGAASKALGEIGIKGEQAARILDRIFGKRADVVVTIKANADPAVDQAKRAQKVLSSIKQNSPAKILARWLGGGDTKRADRDIDGVRQNSPASIRADGSQAISEAQAVQGALNAAAQPYYAVLNVALSLGEGVQAWVDRVWGSADVGLSRWDFGEEEVPWLGPQQRDALSDLLRGAGRRGSAASRNKTIRVTISVEGNWETAIIGLQRLERIAQKTDDKGRATAAAKRARERIRQLRAEEEEVKKYIRTLKVRLNGELIGYTKLKQKLDEARSAMRQLAQEMAEGLNAVDIGSAWDNVKSKRDDIASQISDLKQQQEEYRKAAAESFNPNVIAYYNRKIAETTTEIAELQRQQRQTSLQGELEAQLARTQRFYNQIEQLRRKGLSAAAIAELVRQGPEAGVDIAQRLLADRRLRTTYDDAYKKAAQHSARLGRELAQDVYRPQIEAITKAIDKFERQLNNWIRKKHPNVKTRLEITDYTLPKRKDLPAWVTAPQGRVRYDQNVNVQVSGPIVDPEGTARAIRKLLRDHGNRHGNVSWAA